MKNQPHSNRIACFLATSGHSGVDRVMTNLLPGIAAAGYTVDLLKIHGHGPVLPVDSGVRCVELPAAHVYTALPALVRYLRRERPMVLFSDKDRVNRTSMLARVLARSDARLALRSGTTVSVDLANRGSLNRLVQLGSMRYLYRCADALLFPSACAADDFAQTTGIPRQRLSLVPSPVVTPQLLRRSQEPIEHPWFSPGEAPVILGVGELSKRKDFETLLKAFARIKDSAGFRLVILGRGRRHDQLLALAEQLGIHDRFDLPGFVPNPYPYIRRARVLALTSRWEGMPVALIEALALGTQVVATDCPSGPRELLAEGRYGELVPIGDAVALAAAIDRSLCRTPDSALLARAAAPYTLEQSVAAYLRALDPPPVAGNE